MTDERNPPVFEKSAAVTATVGTSPEVPGVPSTGSLDSGVLHAFDRAGLRDAMQSAIPEIEHCYEEWLKISPRLGGRMNVRFTIDTDDGVEGQVRQVSVGDAGVGNIAFEGCVLSVVSALRFEPPLDGKVDVNYPLAFVAPPRAPRELRPELGNLCRRIRTEALRPEFAKVSPDDLLTVVLANLAKQTPGLSEYIAALLPGDVPPVQRRETFKRAISTAIGAPWVCPEFDALWDGKSI